MKEGITGIGCKGCPVGARYNAFGAFETKDDTFNHPFIAKLFMADEIPVWNEFNKDGEQYRTDNCYADPDLPLCEQAINEGRITERCPNESLVDQARKELQLAGFKEQV